MKRLITVLAMVAGSLAAAPTVSKAANIVDGEKFSLNADGRMQWLGVAQKVDDEFRNDARLFLFMKQARLRFDGRFESVKFDVQWAYGGEETVGQASLSLLDFAFDVPIKGGTRVKVGQFRVPYGRERLTDAGTLNFGDRSIQTLGFNWNRDVGAAIHTYSGKLAGTFAVLTGGGRDVPQRYLPEMLGTPMFVVRAGYNDGVDEDIYQVSARDLSADRTKKAFYVNALYLKDTLIGHSTVLNTRSTDKSLLINANWNPFIAEKPFDQGTLWQAGADAVVRKPMGATVASFEAEGNYASFDNKYGKLVLKGGRIQVGIARKSVEANLRYAALFPDKRMANTFTVAGNTAPQHSSLIADDKPLQELTPSLTYHYKSNVIVVVDAPILINALVFTEDKLGDYVATEQLDQASVVKPGFGSVGRKTVPEVRLMLQFTF
jgi:hypothetical protein